MGGVGLLLQPTLCPHICQPWGHFGGGGGCAPLRLFQAPEHRGGKALQLRKLGMGVSWDLRRSSRLNST